MPEALAIRRAPPERQPRPSGGHWPSLVVDRTPRPPTVVITVSPLHWADTKAVTVLLALSLTAILQVIGQQHNAIYNNTGIFSFKCITNHCCFIRALCQLPVEADANLFEMDDTMLAKLGIAQLPQSLSEALRVMENSSLVAEALGDHIFEWFLRNKRDEWRDYKTHISQFELGRYLRAL